MLTNFDKQVACRTLAQEARGESPVSEQAVAWTMRNRIATGRWGNNLASVCLWRGQFSGWYMPHDPNFAYACHLADNDPVLVQMGTILDQVLAADAGADPTHGATNYINPTVSGWPAWVKGDASKGIKAATPCGQIGHHYFYKGVQ